MTNLLPIDAEYWSHILNSPAVLDVFNFTAPYKS